MNYLKITFILLFSITIISCKKENKTTPSNNNKNSTNVIHTIDGTYNITTKGTSNLHYCVVSGNGKKLFNPFLFNSKSFGNLTPDTLQLFINPNDSTFIIPSNRYYTLTCDCIITYAIGKFNKDTITIEYDYNIQNYGHARVQYIKKQ